MDCPKCQALMKPIVIEGIEIDRCTNCNGLWFDTLEEVRLKSLRVARQIDVGDVAIGRKFNTRSYVRCPRHTDTLLTRLNVPDQPHIQIESCPACYGTFFDAGEFTDFAEKTLLEAIHAFLF